MTTKTELKQVLFDAYDGFADKRLKDISRDAPFIADDRSDADFGADRKLFGWFCQILVEVVDSHRVLVTLRGGVPESPETVEWMTAAGASDTGGGKQFSIAAGEQSELLDLADRVSSITTGGKRYPIAAYKYVCPRVANSLQRLHAALDEAWQ